MPTVSFAEVLLGLPLRVKVEVPLIEVSFKSLSTAEGKVRDFEDIVPVILSIAGSKVIAQLISASE